MPRCGAEAMNLRLAEIATQIAPGAHAALLVDQAGWRLSGKLDVPPNIAIVPPPAKRPELNPQENVWRFMRDNWPSNRLFKSYDDILAHCCAARNKLVDQPWRIMSIGLRQWAHGFSSESLGMRRSAMSSKPASQASSTEQASGRATIWFVVSLLRSPGGGCNYLASDSSLQHLPADEAFEHQADEQSDYGKANQIRLVEYGGPIAFIVGRAHPFHALQRGQVGERCANGLR